MLLSTYQFGSQSPMKRPPFADIPIDTCTDSHYIIPMLRRMEAPYPIPPAITTNTSVKDFAWSSWKAAGN
jgi:hypothetical protein